MSHKKSKILLASLIWFLCLRVGFCDPAPIAETTENRENQQAENPANDETEDQSDDESDDAPQFQYIRISHDDDEKPIALETSVVTFISEGEKHKGVTVELVGAIHVGDEAYYDELNKLFESYDVLLYELVAPEGTRVPKGGRKGNASAVGALQGGMSSLLDLEHQLSKIDYTKENFVHADMSPEEFAKSMSDRGESFLQMFFRAMGQSAAMQATGKQPVSDADLLFALLSKDRSVRLKRLLARQFEDMESSMSIFDGPDGSTLITERNRKCFEVLAKELENGHRRIGVFYGAGHLADMEKRLAADFGMKRTGEKWVAAWDLTKPAKEAVEPEAEAETPKEEPQDVEDDRCPFDDSDQLKKAS